jgi:nucleotide-binding universal stress UspA family protein
MTPETRPAAAPAFRHLLVPLDGSRLAESVLPAAVEFARRFGARLTLLHVLEQGAPTTIHGEPHLADAAAAAAYLDEVARRIAAGGVTVDTHVHPNLERDVANSIVSHAAELGCDLVILATHGSGGLRDVIVGSIALQVLGRGTTPVLLLRPQFAAADRPFLVHRLLVPLDGTPDSERVLPMAEAVARAWQAEVVLVRVVPTRGSLAGEQAAVAAMLPSATAAALEIECDRAREYLSLLLEHLRAQGVAVSAELLRGDPVAMVSETVRRQSADFVAMATHGRAGLGAFWAGSIGARLAERLEVPILIFRSSR